MTRLSRNANVAVLDDLELDRVVVALLPEGPMHVLAGPTAVVWRLCDAPRGPAWITESILAAYPSTPPEARHELDEVLGRLVAAGLLVEHGEP